MFERRIPEWLRHAPTPSVRGFALLSGFEAVARGILISVFPIAMYDAIGNASDVSRIYFLVGLASLSTGLLVPWLNRFIARRFLYVGGALAYAAGCILALTGETPGTVAGLALTTLGTVTVFVCLSAYVLDYIAKMELGRCETLRMVYAALGWTIGPATGIYLYGLDHRLPFLIAFAASLAMLVAFLYMRLGNGKLITRARQPAPNPLAFLGRFLVQPRLVVGWLFAVIRSSGWWAYVVYMPIFAVQSGMDPQTGGIFLSITNSALLAAPLMLRWMQRHSVRLAVRTGFLASGLLFLAATVFAATPPATIAALFAGSFFLILLDVSAGLPFLMAVKPSERTEMSAIYASYRDVSGIVTPGLAWVVLTILPLSYLFGATGLLLTGCYALASSLHPRLGKGHIAVQSSST